MNAVKNNPVIVLGVVLLVGAIIFKEWALAALFVFTALAVFASRRYGSQRLERARREIKLQSGHKLLGIYTQFKTYWREPTVVHVRRGSGRKAFYPLKFDDQGHYQIDYDTELDHIEFARRTHDI